jgi:hypothetical protein
MALFVKHHAPVRERQSGCRESIDKMSPYCRSSNHKKNERERSRIGSDRIRGSKGTIRLRLPDLSPKPSSERFARARYVRDRQRREGGEERELPPSL